ncbi:helicase-related protein [Allocoprobacillus halotolerans]
MQKYKNDYYILVYCGATQYYEHSDDSGSIKQINEVQKVLNKELGMSCLQFTASESSKERQMIIDDFQRGNSCQVLVSMKCLDEGVNIPKIRIAFILASSTNPKEYIQRRGRVLRKAEGKDFAYIYDFITLPRDLHNVKNNEDIEFDNSLIKREVSRMTEFSKLSLNPYATDKLIEELFSIYGAVVYNEEEEGYIL